MIDYDRQIADVLAACDYASRANHCARVTRDHLTTLLAGLAVYPDARRDFLRLLYSGEDGPLRADVRAITER